MLLTIDGCFINNASRGTLSVIRLYFLRYEHAKALSLRRIF